MGQSIPGPLRQAPKGKKCPICTGPAAAEFKPFCSRRCADVDLLRWLNGSYAIPGGAPDADEDGDDSKIQWDAHQADAKPKRDDA